MPLKPPCPGISLADPRSSSLPFGNNYLILNGYQVPGLASLPKNSPIVCGAWPGTVNACLHAFGEYYLITGITYRLNEAEATAYSYAWESFNVMRNRLPTEFCENGATFEFETYPNGDVTCEITAKNGLKYRGAYFISSILTPLGPGKILQSSGNQNPSAPIQNIQLPAPINYIPNFNITGNNPFPQGFRIDPIDSPKIVLKKTCECGATSVGSNYHAHYCPLASNEFP